MWEKGEFARRIALLADEAGRRHLVEEVRIGLGYIGVLLDDKRLGLAALLQAELPAGCSAFPGAGNLAGKEASHLLQYLTEGKNPIEKAVGLATANAILSQGFSEDNRDAIALMMLTSSDRVAMIGFFPPLYQKIHATGAKLTIIEKNPARGVLLAENEKQKVLFECTVAIITATTLLNDTIEEILSCLSSPRHAALLGPSTPMCPEVFTDTPINHLGGAVARDYIQVLRILSEGGGTPAMRPYLNFINLLR